MRPPFGRQRVLFLIVLVLSLVVSGCQAQAGLPELTPRSETVQTPTVTPSRAMDPGATPTIAPTPTPFPVASQTPTRKPTQASSGTSPFTGMALSDEFSSDQTLQIIKLANWPRILRPLYGINRADLVFEYAVGFDQNHLAAFYYTEHPVKVAPLTQLRIPDLRLAEHFQGYLAGITADDVVKPYLDQFLPGRYFFSGMVACPQICNVGGRFQADLPGLDESIDIFGRTPPSSPTTAFIFDQAEPPEADPALSMNLIYASNASMRWQYNARSGHYELWQEREVSEEELEDAPSFDSETGEPIAFENIIYLFAPYTKADNHHYDIDFLPGKTPQAALVVRDGAMVYAKWHTTDDFSPIILTDQEGQPLPLKPGKSWIVFVRSDSQLNQPNPGEWELAQPAVN